MKRNLSVRSLLLFLALSFTALPVVSFGVYEASRGIETAQKDADESNRRAVLLLHKDIDHTIGQFRAFFEGLAADVDLESLRFRDPGRVRNLLGKYPQTLGIILLNKNAVSVASYSVGRELPVGVDYSDRDQVRRALELRQTAISGNINGRAAGVPTIVFSVPLLGDDGSIAGLLNGAVPPDQFRTGYELTGEQFAVIVDAFGRIVSSKGSGNFEDAASELAGLPDGLSGFTFGSTEMQVFASTVDPIGWKIVVGLPRSVILQMSRDAVSRAVVIALICGIIGAAIAGLIAFSTVRQINNVGRQVHRMSAVDLKPIEVTSTALFPEELRTLIANFNDLLDRAARTRHAEFEAISSVADTIFISRSSGQITYVNEAGKRLFGDIEGRHLGDILGVEIASTVLPSQPREWKGDLSLQKADGTSFDAFLSSTPILENGILTALVVIVQDITREKAARDEVVQSEKMITLGELVAGTSHELNNPLAVVTGYSDLLLEEKQLTEDQRAKIESIRKSALRASNVVHSLLAFARKRKPSRSRTDVNGVVEASLGLKDYDLRTSGILVEKHLDPSLPVVFADANQIQQVVLNVINNAQDAVLESSNPPKIVIRTEVWDGTVYIKVEDSGVGISKTDLKKVFDPFFTTKPVGKGTGLGLSISYGIIREHGGEIQIQSQVGEGTLVSVELPLDASTAPAPPKAPEPSVTSGMRRILVVDDEPDIVTILKIALTRDGSSIVDTASTVSNALALARSSMYDYIVTDMKMPEGSGIDLYKQLCSINPIYGRRVIFLTGDTSNPATIDFLEKEGLPYFSKPFDLQSMDILIKSASRAGTAPTHG